MRKIKGDSDDPKQPKIQRPATRKGGERGIYFNISVTKMDQFKLQWAILREECNGQPINCASFECFVYHYPRWKCIDYRLFIY